ncbi:MAG: diacylglycerol kinase [Epulopiscium sp. Nuni2H_MBin003]|nr:MAG: diacylglycerol kinase [Epulopiscium sp. Nuni2H_MBin003]
MINMIVAVSSNNQIGLNNTLPWYIKEDLQYFKKLTWGHTVIMGRKTFESIKKPLPHRREIILANSSYKPIRDVEIFNDFESALKFAKSVEDVFIIGGGKIYNLFLPYTDVLYITLVDIHVDGDTEFPNYTSDFICIDTTSKQDIANPIDYKFTKWIRK